MFSHWSSPCPFQAHMHALTMTPISKIGWTPIYCAFNMCSCSFMFVQTIGVSIVSSLIYSSHSSLCCLSRNSIQSLCSTPFPEFFQRYSYFQTHVEMIWYVNTLPFPKILFVTLVETIYVDMYGSKHSCNVKSIYYLGYVGGFQIK